MMSVGEVHPTTSPRDEQRGEPECPVGNTVVASMQFDAVRQVKSAEKLVLSVTKQSVLGLEVRPSTVRLVESLVWPFVARRSERDVWFSDKEYSRMVRSFRKTAVVIEEYTSEDNREQTFLKFWLDSLLCQVFKDSTLPVREAWIVKPLFSGWLKRFVVRAVARRDVAFIYSLQKGSKRFWPNLGEEKKKQAYAKHAARLSQEHGTVPTYLANEIERTSRQIYGGHKELLPTKFMPSGSACLQASYRLGGALGLFRPLELPLDSDDSKVIGKLPVLNSAVNRWRQEQYRFAEKQSIRRTTFDKDGRMPGLDVEVVAIPEPGKFRIITKGDGFLYSALQPIQGLMLDAWKKHHSSTMLKNDLTDSIRKIDKEVDLPFWCSGDYEAATDLLKRDATYCAFRPLGYLNPSFQSSLAWVSLLPGRATYPDGTSIEAIEGQLMGHPLSFPLLCTINLAVYRAACWKWLQKPPTQSELKGYNRPEGEARLLYKAARLATYSKLLMNVLVNGDDILFKCDDDLYKYFVETATDAGFKLSVGKNYLSRDCCMINSQVFRRSGGQMTRYGYLNLKLITGSSAKDGDSTATPTQIGKELSAMVRLCPWANCAIPAAFKRWKQDWFGPYYRPNWYLPVHLGGFGLDRSLGPSDFKVTKSQREMAARFIADPRLALYRRLGNISIPTAELAGALCKWEWVVGDYVPTQHESVEINDAWLQRIAYAARAASDPCGREPADRVVVARLGPQYRLRPMSMKTIELYWNAQLFAVQPPPCPPIAPIKIRNIFRY